MFFSFFFAQRDAISLHDECYNDNSLRIVNNLRLFVISFLSFHLRHMKKAEFYAFGGLTKCTGTQHWAHNQMQLNRSIVWQRENRKTRKTKTLCTSLSDIGCVENWNADTKLKTDFVWKKFSDSISTIIASIHLSGRPWCGWCDAKAVDDFVVCCRNFYRWMRILSFLLQSPKYNSSWM